MIKHYSKNIAGRDFVVGDIHGCFTKLTKALAEVDFDCSVDRLFSVGDLIDRGEESEDVLSWLGKPWFIPVRGNHDDFAIRHAKVGRLDFINYSRNGGAWFMALTYSEQLEIAEELDLLPHAISVDSSAGLIGIVHADIPTSTWGDLKEVLESEISRNKMKPYSDYLMWSRDRAESKDESVITDLHMLIVGHTPVKEPARLGNVVYIDTMGWRDDGYFTILQIN